MIILLYGPDTYRARQRLSFYQEGFKKKYDPQGLNVVHLDGETITLDELRKNVGQVGFLAKKRFIVITNLIAKNKKKSLQKEVVEYLDTDWSDDNVLIFLEETNQTKKKKKAKTTRTASPLMNRLLKEKSEEFPLLTGTQLNTWVRDAIQNRGGRIESGALTELVGLVGTDLWAMVSEINKLINYSGTKGITVAAVRELVKAKFDDNIFHLTDALASRNAKVSFKLLQDQIAVGSNELYILTMLIRQFRILLQARELIDTEPNHYTVASRLQIPPFIAQKAIRDAQKFTLDELKGIYQQLLQIDMKIKSTQEDPRLMFDLLITRVCSS